jgi:peptide/nickel transport system substrate-binding protein
MSLERSRLEIAIVALVLIAIIMSASTLYYTLDITAELARTTATLTEKLGGMTEGLIALSAADKAIAEALAGLGANITDIQDRLSKVEEAIKAPSGAKYGGTLVISLGTDVPIFDPQKSTGMQNLGIIRLVCETLTDFDPRTGKLFPRLAESWESSSDATKHTIHLRKNIKFHDGTPFNATAVKVTIMDRLLNPEAKSPARGSFSMIQSIDIIDEYTVVVNTTPYAPIMALFNYAPSEIISPTQWYKLGDNFYKEPIGTGPYKFVEHIKGDHITLVANEEYWGGRPYIDTIIMKPIPEAAARVMALETGVAQVITNVPPDDYFRLKDDPRFYALPTIPQRSMHVSLNTQWGPLKDKRVRQALNYAIDKKAIIDSIFKGTAHIMDCPCVAPAAFGYTPIGIYEYNPEKAKALLAEAGYPDGFEVELIYGSGRFLMDTQVVEAIQAYLADVGVKVKITALEWAAFQAAEAEPIETSKVQMAFVGFGLPTLDADQAFHDLRSDCWPPLGLEPTFYSNATFDTLHEQGRSIVDPAKRLEIYKQIAQIIFEDAPWIFLYYEPPLHLARVEVQGVFIRHDETIWLDGAWITKP